MASTVVPQASGASARPASDPASGRYRNVQVGLFVLGAVLLPFGLLVIGLGWYGSAHTPYLYNQMSYLVSGGLMGLGLTFAGGFLYFGAWLAKMAADQRETSREIADALSTLTDTLSRAGGAPVGMNTALYAARPIAVPVASGGVPVVAPVAPAVAPVAPAASAGAERESVETDVHDDEPATDADALSTDEVVEASAEDDTAADAGAHPVGEPILVSPVAGTSVMAEGAHANAHATTDTAVMASVGSETIYFAPVVGEYAPVPAAVAVEDGATLVTVGHGTTVHRRDCQLIAHRTDITYLGEYTEAPPTCRVCRPEL